MRWIFQPAMWVLTAVRIFQDSSIPGIWRTPNQPHCTPSTWVARWRHPGEGSKQKWSSWPATEREPCKWEVCNMKPWKNLDIFGLLVNYVYSSLPVHRKWKGFLENFESVVVRCLWFLKPQNRYSRFIEFHTFDGNLLNLDTWKVHALAFSMEKGLALATTDKAAAGSWIPERLW